MYFESISWSFFEVPMRLNVMQDILQIETKYEGEDYDPFINNKKAKMSKKKLMKRKGQNVKHKQEVLSPDI